MFPFDIDEDEITPVIEEEKEPTDYEIDFNTGRLTGKIITGLDAIIQWVRIVLSTDRYYYPQYIRTYCNRKIGIIQLRERQFYVELPEFLMYYSNVVSVCSSVDRAPVSGAGLSGVRFPPDA